MPSRPSRDCPECGTPMDHGFLVAESYIGGAKWMTRRTRLGAGGKALVNPDGFGNVYLEGFRCSGCRYLSLHY